MIYIDLKFTGQIFQLFNILNQLQSFFPQIFVHVTTGVQANNSKHLALSQNNDLDNTRWQSKIYPLTEALEILNHDLPDNMRFVNVPKEILKS